MSEEDDDQFGSNSHCVDENQLQNGIYKDARVKYDSFVDSRINYYVKKLKNISQKIEKLTIQLERQEASSSDSGERLRRAQAKQKKMQQNLNSLRLQACYEQQDVPPMAGQSSSLTEQTEVKDSQDHVQLSGKLKINPSIWHRLFDYQKEGVRWLANLKSGGILGDEMGLGKTIQIAAFLSTLDASEGRVLVLCPGTVLNQWKEEIQSWAPQVKVSIVHASAADKCDTARSQTGGFTSPLSLHQDTWTGALDLAETLSKVKTLEGSCKVLLTSYGTLMARRQILVSHQHYQYLILDEGHKIKNPTTDLSGLVKGIDAQLRIILTGTPMQNNLKELWSLIDFVSPGKLGSLVEFQVNFGVPITQGGYANASPIQVETAYQCACTLRDILKPLMLRRLKLEVNLQLPGKREQVLFCRLTSQQRRLYEQFLDSGTCASVLAGRGNLFSALITLRKLCNHPDLYSFDHADEPPSTEEEKRALKDLHSVRWQHFGCPRRSGKMLVCANLLKNWHRGGGHKVLLFSQSRKILDLLESLVKSASYTYCRMDGSTSISQRSNLVAKFNQDPSIFCFLLTTRVGGLGVNLTGADRVIIFDPDWNPTTDTQAKERAWRVGQTRDVLVYRLISSGTVEEKMYQRQIFKQFLSNRILKNPRQSRFFKMNDLLELFTLTDEESKKRSNQYCFETNHPTSKLAAKALLASSETGNTIETAEFLRDVGAGQAVGTLQSSREERLRAIAKRLSRQIGKQETPVEGKRIFMLAKKQRHMEQDDEEQQQESRKRKGNEDDFVHGLLLAGRDKAEWQQIESKRRKVDVMEMNEAEAVAKEALLKTLPSVQLMVDEERLGMLVDNSDECLRMQQQLNRTCLSKKVSQWLLTLTSWPVFDQERRFTCFGLVTMTRYRPSSRDLISQIRKRQVERGTDDEAEIYLRKLALWILKQFMNETFTLSLKDLSRRMNSMELVQSEQCPLQPQQVKAFIREIAHETADSAQKKNYKLKGQFILVAGTACNEILQQQSHSHS
ncbi:DNA excision repair protein ERCC-6 [Cichlidogyrus casuarinus]|uniref:DNA excision repair protein ERCC-6 n=1 Tax=Cichlidogyrus casuarinus TaxID=1844966 RepID=A0ABD2QIF7_9PLAT